MYEMRKQNHYNWSRWNHKNVVSTYCNWGIPYAPQEARIRGLPPRGCDVYCYKHVDGSFYIHIAEIRFLETGTKPIGLPHDGATFIHDTGKDTATLLEYLRNLGYRVPLYAISALQDKIAGQ